MSISGKEVAIILANYFDAGEFNSLHSCLLGAGALVSVVGETAGAIIKDFDRKTEVEVEVSFEEARSYDFRAALISNGYAPDAIRVNSAALDFIRNMYNSGMIVGAISHGPHVLVSLGILKDKSVSGSPSIKVDIENAGAHYVDEPVTIDGNIITARGLEDIKGFCNAIIEEIARSSEAVA